MTIDDFTMSFRLLKYRRGCDNPVLLAAALKLCVGYSNKGIELLDPPSLYLVAVIFITCAFNAN
jgi:hypothetical protein